MRIEAVHYVKVFRELRRHFGQIRRAAAADDQHVDLIAKIRDRIGAVHRHAGKGFHCCRIAPRKHGDKLCIRVLPHGAFHASAEIPVSVNGDSHILLPPKIIIVYSIL